MRGLEADGTVQVISAGLHSPCPGERMNLIVELPVTLHRELVVVILFGIYGLV